jgi:hypothetical protein
MHETLFVRGVFSGGARGRQGLQERLKARVWHCATKDSFDVSVYVSVASLACLRA